MALSPAQCRAARGLRDISRPALAEESGISTRTLIDFESGKRKPNPATSAALVRALNEFGIEILDNGGVQPKE